MRGYSRYISILIAIALSANLGCAMMELDGEPYWTWDEWEDPRAMMGEEAPEDSITYSASSAERPRIDRQPAVASDLFIGMSMDDVVSVWGEPREIFSAGHPRFGNQKWIYTEGLSRRYGISRTRIVYFEGGRVAGWETRR